MAGRHRLKRRGTRMSRSMWSRVHPGIYVVAVLVVAAGALLLLGLATWDIQVVEFAR